MHKILVIGEVCIDHFYYGNCKRLCPEAPVPVFLPNGEFKVTEGMAGNVKNNLISLSKSKIEVKSLRQAELIVKSRYVDKSSGYLLLRVDNDPSCSPLKFDFNIAEYNAVVISDYDKGFLSREVLKKILQKAARLQIPTFMDTKKILSPEWSSDAFVVKINKREFESHDQIGLDCYKNLVVTSGKDGSCLLNDSGNFHSQAKEVAVREVSGAGDTYLAAYVIEYLNLVGTLGQLDALTKAMDFANKAAGVAVSKPGVVEVSWEEI